LGRSARLPWAAVGVFCLAFLGLSCSSRAASGSSAQFRDDADALFTNAIPLRLILEIPEPGLDSLRRDPRKYVAARLRDGNTVYSNVAVHLKGAAGSFRRVDDRPGLTLNFSYMEPDGSRFHGLKKVHLNNSVQDPSHLSEWVAGEMFRQAGVPTARAAPALLELNGRNMGLYVILEAMDKDFLAQYFKNPKGNLYGQSTRCDVTDDIERMEGDEPLTREELAALAGAVREEDPALRRERLEQTLDIDRFLSFMALEAILCHWDGYTIARHNYRIYHDLDTGRMVFFPHDLDQLMVRQNVGLVPRANGLVAQAVLNTPALRARYLQRVCDLATNLFVVPWWTSRVDRAAAALAPALQAYDADIARDVAGAASEFKSRIINRGRQLERQLGILNGTVRRLDFSTDINLVPE
jgi:spore coat protein H